MNQSTRIQYTETFDHTIEDAIHHSTTVIDQIEDTIECFEKNVINNPLMYSRCEELSNLGITTVRDFKKNGFRILYTVNENNLLITGLALLKQRQNITQTLIRYCLIYK